MWIIDSNSLVLTGLPQTKPYDQDSCADAPWALTGMELWHSLGSLFQWRWNRENAQCELLLMQFHSIYSSPDSSLREGISTSPSAFPLEEAVGCPEVTPQPSPSWANQVTSDTHPKSCTLSPPPPRLPSSLCIQDSDSGLIMISQIHKHHK